MHQVSYIVITLSEPPRYFGPFLTESRAERCQELLPYMGYRETQIIELENFEKAWQATAWNEEKGVWE